MIRPGRVAAIDLRHPAGPQIHEVLRRSIITMRLRPRQKVSEAELALELGVSRTPVREALIKLAEDRLVEILPQRGSFITPIRLQEVLEARFIREALEIAVVRDAAASGRAAILGQLESLLRAQRAAARDKDLERFLDLDEAFHHTLSESIDKQRSWRLIQTVKHQLDRVRYLSLPEPGNLAFLIRQHAAIAEAVLAGKPDKAETLMRAHLREVLRFIEEKHAKEPDLFE
jgi:GntR family transcriptional regulator, rspAB operon transcriptional repressor